MGSAATPTPTDLLFEPAEPDDDAQIRALLRTQPLGGQVQLAFEREPDYRLAAGIEGHRHHTFVCRQESTRQVLGLCSRAVRQVWVNGKQRNLGYLAQMRGHPSLKRHIARLLVDGFTACERTRRSDELPYDLTAIVADNRAARSLLENASRRLDGLPAYRPLCEFVTLMIPVGRQHGAIRREARPVPMDSIADCLQRNGRRFQFAPVWTAADLCNEIRCRNLRPEDFIVHRQNGRVTACLARWNQGAFKQAVVRGYSGQLRRYRHLVNLFAALTGRPQLPRVGEPIRFAYLSHLAIDNDDDERLIELIEEARRRSSGLDYLALGLAEASPMLAAAQRHFGGRSYRSVLYLVHRVGNEAAIEDLDRRTPHVEVAIL
jgi:hypothetical protein